MVVVGLIEKAINSTRPEVDPRLLKAIKSVVRDSDSELHLAAQTLTSLLKRDHSQIRYLALLIIDELFMRSKLFRTLIVEQLDRVLTLTVGFRRNLPLPAPATVASVLRSKAIEFLEKWNVTYGIHYRQLRLGYDYLKNNLRYQFPDLQANVARIQRERRERQLRTREMLLSKFEMLKTNLPSIKDEIQSTIDQISQCLDIVTNKDENFPCHPVDDEDILEFRSSELLRIRIDSLKEGAKIKESSENRVVFDTLRELYKLLVTKYLVSLQDWISVLVRVEVEDNRFRDSTLKEFIDIKNSLQAMKGKCEELGCGLPKTITLEDEDIWEEGTIGSTTKSNEDLAVEPPSVQVRRENPACSYKTSKGKNKVHAEVGNAESDLLRSKLLAEAPHFKWDSFLDRWGPKRDVLANQRGLELESHWGRVDYDAVIPSDKIAELNFHTSFYEEEPTEIQPCHAPLKKGGLCERRDLRVCPFHGPIIPRDDEGKPIDDHSKSPSVKEVTLDVGSELILEQLAKQAVKNVRERDEGGATTKKLAKQKAKKAKLAQVREHNETVLRDAALVASTSGSSVTGEDLEKNSSWKPPYKGKEERLASMLKKKVTSRERLAQRVSSSRRKDSTF